MTACAPQVWRVGTGWNHVASTRQLSAGRIDHVVGCRRREPPGARSRLAASRQSCGPACAVCGLSLGRDLHHRCAASTRRWLGRASMVAGGRAPLPWDGQGDRFRLGGGRRERRRGGLGRHAHGRVRPVRPAPDSFWERGAGLAGGWRGALSGARISGPAVPFLLPPFGDDPHDQIMIAIGQAYYKQIAKGVECGCR